MYVDVSHCSENLQVSVNNLRKEDKFILKNKEPVAVKMEPIHTSADSWIATACLFEPSTGPIV